MNENRILISHEEYYELLCAKQKLDMIEQAFFESAELSYNQSDLECDFAEDIFRIVFPVHYGECLDTLKELEAKKQNRWLRGIPQPQGRKPFSLCFNFKRKEAQTVEHVLYSI